MQSSSTPSFTNSPQCNRSLVLDPLEWLLQKQRRKSSLRDKGRSYPEKPKWAGCFKISVCFPSLPLCPMCGRKASNTLGFGLTENCAHL